MKPSDSCLTHSIPSLKPLVFSKMSTDGVPRMVAFTRSTLRSFTDKARSSRPYLCGSIVDLFFPLCVKKNFLPL
ncbi:hypothetical protein QJS04_geneDACA023636 [Acorus gramineus]|uniref:Uncharacterized protein n=1 Tax=Acorus gramineus TaxID=55184 RepID=A0AAV9A9U8_ACOGR|nr:hypothetical protein QJS04_geneDACA023636 [Acorus gramineus]